MTCVDQITVSAPVNIAVIKYWGKRDQELMLPTNSSLSLTLTDLLSTTTIQKAENGDEIWLNDEKVKINKRVLAVLESARLARRQMEAQNSNLEKLCHLSVLIVSKNNFPTAAGLASSASGYAALTFALAKFYDLDLNMGILSKFARMGSGSACRSMFGGFVAWEMGVLEDGSDSMAVQVAPEDHWTDIEAFVLVVSDHKKDIGSTVGMQETVLTSELLKHRIKIVPERMEIMKKAIKERDFETFAELTMKDSNQFHAVCLDTYPPIFYLNDVSKSIISLVTAYNQEFSNSADVAYTFDAGPNAVLFMRKSSCDLFFQILNYFFPPPEDEQEAYYGSSLRFLEMKATGAERMIEVLSKRLPVSPPGSLKRIINTRVGGGPQVLAKQYDPYVSLTQPN